jgi:hypothetical protein
MSGMKRAMIVTFCILFAVTGCTAPHRTPEPTVHHTPTASHGTIQGRLVLDGMSVRPVNGSVVLDGPAHYVVTVGTDGTWTAEVVPGTYVIVGTSPKYNSGSAECRAIAPVSVAAESAVHATVRCVEK